VEAGGGRGGGRRHGRPTNFLERALRAPFRTILEGIARAVGCQGGDEFELGSIHWSRFQRGVPGRRRAGGAKTLGSPSDLASPGPTGLQVHKGVSGALDALHLPRTVLNNERPHYPRA
jgi:hypothetical protein